MINRQRGGVPRAILDKVADLQMAYADFLGPMIGKPVVIEQIWNRESKSWSFVANWEYRERTPAITSDRLKTIDPNLNS